MFSGFHSNLLVIGPGLLISEWCTYWICTFVDGHQPTLPEDRSQPDDCSVFVHLCGAAACSLLENMPPPVADSVVIQLRNHGRCRRFVEILGDCGWKMKKKHPSLTIVPGLPTSRSNKEKSVYHSFFHTRFQKNNNIQQIRLTICFKSKLFYELAVFKI